MNAWRWIRKTIIFLGAALLIFCGMAATLSIFYGDQLVDRFVAEANKKIATPIQTAAIEVSWWEKFPSISIALREVVIDGSLPGATDTLGVAENIFCTFNAWDIIRGNWEVDQIYMENGRLFLVHTELGDNNYTIIAKDSTSDKKGVGLNLQKIILTDVALTFLDLMRNQQYELQLQDVEASLRSQQRVFDIDLSGEVTSQYFRIKDYLYLENKQLEIESEISFQELLKKWEFNNTEIAVNDSKFDVQGWYQGADSSSMDMDIQGKNTNIQTLLSLLPPQISEDYRNYRSKGEVYFQTSLKGPVGGTNSPEINIRFGCNNASFYHPNYKKGVNNVNLQGHYFSPRANDLSVATLSLKDIDGTMESRSFKGNLTMKNLKDYWVDGDFEGILDLASWQKFLPQSQVNDASGTLSLDVSFRGPVKYLKSNQAVDNFQTSGEVTVSDLSFGLNQNSLPFEDFQGHFLFNGRDLAISNFSGRIGNSDFLINGLFRNIIAFLFSKNQPIGIEADLQAKLIDLDELLTGSIKEQDVTVVGNQSYTSFEISPRLALTFDCKIDRLKFRRFRGNQIKGKLRVTDQVAVGKDLSVETIGGIIQLDGEVNGKRQNHLTVKTRSSYDGIHIDSLFYVFENFNQDFLEDRHLKGQAFAEIDTYMAFDQNLRFKSDQLVVDAGLIIENGELNNFAPMQKLSSFVERQSLVNMTFADLKNDIHIEDRIIHLPNMVVQSNVTTIMVNGTHSFDQNIDYRLKVPLQSPKKDKDAYFGALEDDGLNTNLYLKIVGNTKDYRIIYDKEAVKTKIKEDLREEKWELRDAIRNKGVKEETQELNEEEFFDFDEADSTAIE